MHAPELLCWLHPCAEQQSHAINSLSRSSSSSRNNCTHVNWKVFTFPGWGRRWLRYFSYSLTDTCDGTQGPQHSTQHSKVVSPKERCYRTTLALDCLSAGHYRQN
jgi:hypothetical protein